jgi:hypothetical protein
MASDFVFTTAIFRILTSDTDAIQAQAQDGQSKENSNASINMTTN